jgi:hypothetical protein
MRSGGAAAPPPPVSVKGLSAFGVVVADWGTTRYSAESTDDGLGENLRQPLLAAGSTVT